MHRGHVDSQLEAVHAKLDALGAVLTALARSSAVQLPRDALTALGGLKGTPTASKGAPSSTGSSDWPGEKASLSEEPPAGGGGDGLFEALSTKSLLVRLSLVVGAAVLAVSVPNFGFAVALMGSLAGT